MSVKLNRKDLTLGQLQFIRLTCTLFTNPLSQENKKARLRIEALRSDPSVPEVAINFAIDCLFSPLDPVLVAYLGSKLRDLAKACDGFSNAQTIEMYAADKDYITVPLILGVVLTKTRHNKNKQFQEREFKFTGTLRPLQSEIMPELLSNLEKSGTVILGTFPGSGKTAMGAYMASWTKLLTIVFIHMSTQISQWQETFERFTDAQVWTVGENEYSPETQVIICMDGRLQHIPGDVLEKIGTVIIDEAHLYCVQSRVRCWLAIQPRYLILETATLERPDDAMHKMAWLSCGKWGVFKRSPQEFKIIPVLTGITPEIRKGPRGADWHDLLKQLLYHDQRDAAILYLLNLHYPNDKILIMTPQKKHVERLDELLTQFRFKHGVFCGSMSGYTESPILIATGDKAGTGFDEATFSKEFNGVRFNVLITVTTIKKPTTLNQRVGRVMRSDAPVTYVLLDNCTIIKKHMNIMCWYFRTYTNGILMESMDLSAIKKPKPRPVQLKIVG